MQKVAKFSGGFIPNAKMILDELSRVQWKLVNKNLPSPSILDLCRPFAPTLIVQRKERDLQHTNRLQRETLLTMHRCESTCGEVGYAAVDKLWTSRHEVCAFDVSGLLEKKSASLNLMVALDQMYMNQRNDISEPKQDEKRYCFVATAECDDGQALHVLQTLGYRAFVKDEAPELLDHLRWKSFHSKPEFDYPHLPLAAGRRVSEWKKKQEDPDHLRWIPFVKLL